MRSKEEGTWGALWRSLSFRVRREMAGWAAGGGGSDRRVGEGSGGGGSVVLEAFFFLVAVPAAFFFLGGISVGGMGRRRTCVLDSK